MAYTAIDGDVSDLIDTMGEYTKPFRAYELRAYLLAARHSEEEVVAAIRAWQQNRFRQIVPQWEAFDLAFLLTARTRSAKASMSRMRRTSRSPRQASCG